MWAGVWSKAYLDDDDTKEKKADDDDDGPARIMGAESLKGKQGRFVQRAHNGVFTSAEL